ncbi:MAG: FecR domain-containing protein [Oligoflexia bacterium]|nr:FecR domain-containing protein [Oligoflexia bacterium]
MIRIILLISVFLFSFNSFSAAKRFVAKVSKVRGKVTVLSPGQHKARILRVGMKLKEDTSIVTSKRSFAQVVFFDKTKLNIGPESKALIVKGNTKSEPGVVGLLKGKLRTSVKKAPSKRLSEKFIIQTRNAAMGVRGTEFQTIYNPDGNLTSLLTYKGEVAMVKLDDTDEDALDVERDSRTKKVKLKKASPKKDIRPDVKKVFKKKKAVVVKQGQFSGTVNKLETVSLPVKINPVQLNILYKNEDFKEVKTQKKAKVDPVKEKLAIKPVEQEAPLEGVIDKDKKVFAPKAGGFLDLKTGLYIPPSNESKLNKKLGVYVDNKTGGVNAASGEYIPPKGLKLDTEKGFVPDLKSAPKVDKKVLIAQARSLNENTATDVVVGDGNKKRKIVKSFFPRDLYTRESIVFSIAHLDEELKVGEISRDVSRTYRTDEGKSISIRWNQKSFSEFKNLRPYFGLTISKVDYSSVTRENRSQPEDTLHNFEFGFDYSFSKRLSFLFRTQLEQTLILNHSLTNNVQTSSFDVVTIPRFNIGVNSDLVKSEKAYLNGEALFGINFTKTKNDFTVDRALNLELSLGVGYWWSKSFRTELRAYTKHEKYNVNSQYFENDQSRDRSGVKANFLFAL